MAATKKLSVAEKLLAGEKVIHELAGAAFEEEAGALDRGLVVSTTETDRPCPA